MKHVVKTIVKHIAVWFMIMCLMFFGAVPIARTSLFKWAVVAVLAFLIAEVSIILATPIQPANNDKN